MPEHSPEQDAIARVLVDWLSHNGLPVTGPSDHLLVPISWLRECLAKTRDNNPSPDRRSSAGRSWNRAVDEIVNHLDWYERKAREVSELRGVGEAK